MSEAEKTIERADTLWLEAKTAFATFKEKLQESEALLDTIEVSFQAAATTIPKSPTMEFLTPKSLGLETNSKTLDDLYEDFQRGREARRDEVKSLFRQAIDEVYPNFKKDFEASIAEAYVPLHVVSSAEASAAHGKPKEDDEEEASEAQA